MKDACIILIVIEKNNPKHNWMDPMKNFVFVIQSDGLQTWI